MISDEDYDATEARLSAPGAVLAAAHYYIGLGLPVFPVQGKVPFAGTSGFKDATLDPELIARWWQRWPDAGVAAPTGLLYDVIDVDGPVGYLTIAKLAQQAGVTHVADLFPQLLGKVKTVRGCHYLIPPTGRGNGANVLGGIDTRGAGGYTVLPPSKRDGTVAYHWTIPPTFRAEPGAAPVGVPVDEEQQR